MCCISLTGMMYGNYLVTQHETIGAESDEEFKGIPCFHESSILRLILNCFFIFVVLLPLRFYSIFDYLLKSVNFRYKIYRKLFRDIHVCMVFTRTVIIHAALFL